MQKIFELISQWASRTIRRIRAQEFWKNPLTGYASRDIIKIWKINDFVLEDG